MKALPYVLAVLTAGALVASGAALATSDDAFSAHVSNRDALVWPTVPDDPSLQWASQLESPWSVGADDDFIYVLSDREAGGSTVTRLDRGTGDVVDDMPLDELSEAGQFAEIVGVVDGIALLQVCPESCFQAGIDVDRGRVVWKTDGEDVSVSLIGDTVVRQSETTLEVLDPATGEPVETFDGDFVVLDWFESVLYVVDGPNLVAFDAIDGFKELMGPVEIEQTDAFVLVDDLLVVARGSELWTSDGNFELRRRTSLPGQPTGIWSGGDDTVLVEFDNGTTVSYRVGDPGTPTRGRTSDGGTAGQLPGSGNPPTVMLPDDGTVQFVEASSGKALFGDEACCNFGNNGLLLDRGGLTVAYDYEAGRETWSIPSADWETLVDNGIISVDFAAGEISLYE